MSIRIFIAYASTDETFVDRLIELLNEDIKIEKSIEVYEIDQNNPEAYTHLGKADFVFLMVSSNFLASDYCYRPEMKQAILLHEQGRIHITSIILRPVYWEKTPIAALPMMPQNAQPITTHKNQSAIFSEIATNVKNMIYKKIYQSVEILEGNSPGKNAFLSGSNPYYDYAAVREPTMFFGRKKELTLLYKAILDRQCVSLIGMRYIGKSSVLRCMSLPEVQAQYGYSLQNYIFIQLDLRDSLRKTHAGFFSLVCEEILSQVQNIPNLGRSAEKEENQLLALLQSINDAGFYPVLLMDTFDNVIQNEQFDNDFFSFLHSLAGKDQISYITTSLSPLHEASHSKVSSNPFFNIFRICELGSLTGEEAHQLITVPASRTGHPFTSDEVSWVFAQAGRHPFFIQRFCQMLFERKLHLSSSQEVDLKQVEERVYSELRLHFDEIWYAASAIQQKELKREAHLYSSQQPKQLELSESALFRHYIRTTFQAEQTELSAEELKTILEHYQDREYLAKSVLATMHYVEAKHQRKNARSHEIGMLVQDFLYQAFERMKPAGERDDFSEEWRSYNILHFRYIRHQLPTELVSPKIGIGRRQYFRSLEMAIRTLRLHLLELNNESFVL